jgi:hypothetical protein
VMDKLLQESFVVDRKSYILFLKDEDYKVAEFGTTVLHNELIHWHYFKK